MSVNNRKRVIVAEWSDACRTGDGPGRDARRTPRPLDGLRQSCGVHGYHVAKLCFQRPDLVAADDVTLHSLRNIFR